MDFSIEELSIIALLLDEDEKKEKRRHWVHPIWKFRDTEGEFATLYRGYNWWTTNSNFMNILG